MMIGSIVRFRNRDWAPILKPDAKLILFRVFTKCNDEAPSSQNHLGDFVGTGFQSPRISTSFLLLPAAASLWCQVTLDVSSRKVSRGARLGASFGRSGAFIPGPLHGAYLTCPTSHSRSACTFTLPKSRIREGLVRCRVMHTSEPLTPHKPTSPGGGRCHVLNNTYWKFCSL